MPGRDLVSLSEGEYEVLKRMAERGFRKGSLEEASRLLGRPPATLASIFELLASKGLVKVETREKRAYRLTERGARELEGFLPEEEAIRILSERGGSAPLEDLDAIMGSERLAAAIRFLKGRGLAEVREEGDRKILALRVPVERALMEAGRARRVLESIAKGEDPRDEEELRDLLRRGLVRKEDHREKWIAATADPASVLKVAVVSVSKLTADMIASGAWRRASLKPYNVEAEPPRIYPAMLHFLQEFIEELRDIMREMGFREVQGPLVELELFNFDLLFQAQDHPAREVHDTLRPDLPPADLAGGLEELASRAKSVHERGWANVKYEWRSEVAARRVLRSQMTSVSARILSGVALGGQPRPPIRFFSLGRVFRRESIDSRHLPEFHQLDGIEGWEGYTFRDLLGTLAEIGERLGLRLIFKPAYFPFTEPSVEGYARLPNGSLMELFGAGLFRPEVLEMAGIDYPVGAWGMGVERLAAAYYGVSDIRELYERDVTKLRERRVKV